MFEKDYEPLANDFACPLYWLVIWDYKVVLVIAVHPQQFPVAHWDEEVHREPTAQLVPDVHVDVAIDGCDILI